MSALKFHTNNYLKIKVMTHLTRSNRPSTLEGSWLTDFFDDDFVTPFNAPLGRRSMPAANVRETDKSFEIDLAAPGFTKKDFNLSIENGCLMVSAEKNEEKEQKEDNYTRREFGYQSFSRSFNLPTNTNEEDINARYEDGILKLSIAKKALPEAKQKKSIMIK
jgi:HSP20 family protein